MKSYKLKKKKKGTLFHEWYINPSTGRIHKTRLGKYYSSFSQIAWCQTHCEPGLKMQPQSIAVIKCNYYIPTNRGEKGGEGIRKTLKITGFLNCNSIKVILQLRQSNDHISEICNTYQELRPRAVHTYYW